MGDPFTSGGMQTVEELPLWLVTSPNRNHSSSSFIDFRTLHFRYLHLTVDNPPMVVDLLQPDVG